MGVVEHSDRGLLGSRSRAGHDVPHEQAPVAGHRGRLLRQREPGAGAPGRSRDRRARDEPPPVHVPDSRGPARSGRPPGPPRHLVCRSAPWLRVPRGRLSIGLRGRRGHQRARRTTGRRGNGEVKGRRRPGAGGVSEPLRSTLLVGKVQHRRARPSSYGLEHDVWYFGLELDELDAVFRLARLLRRNRRAVVELRDADHLPEPARDLPRDIKAELRANGLDERTWRIELVTNLRIAGYVFNPASFFLCRDESDLLRAVVVEVHNTYGERHLYTLLPETAAARTEQGTRPFSAGMAKRFWVSPFIGLDGRYRVTVLDRGSTLRIAINLREPDGPLL